MEHMLIHELQSVLIPMLIGADQDRRSASVVLAPEQVTSVPLWTHGNLRTKEVQLLQAYFKQ